MILDFSRRFGDYDEILANDGFETERSGGMAASRPEECNATQDDKHVHGATLLPTRASSQEPETANVAGWDKQGGPSKCAKQRSRNGDVPRDSSTSIKSAMTRTWESQLSR